MSIKSNPVNFAELTLVTLTIYYAPNQFRLETFNVYKKSIAIVIIASSLASSAFATTSIINKITNHRSTASTVRKQQLVKQTNQDYTDFSGTWMVNCGDGHSTSTVIKNDANSITLDGVEFRIGQGLNGHSESNEVRTSSENISMEWNEDGSALTIKSINFFKSHIDGSAIDTDLYKARLTMQNGQINLDGEWATFKDVTQTAQPKAEHCTFIK